MYTVTIDGKSYPIACNDLAPIVELFRKWNEDKTALLLPPTIEQIAEVYYWCLTCGAVDADINAIKSGKPFTSAPSVCMQTLIKWVKEESGTPHYEQQCREMCRMILDAMIMPNVTEYETLAGNVVISRLKERPNNIPLKTSIEFVRIEPNSPNILSLSGRIFN